MMLYYEALYDAQLDQWIRRRPMPAADLQRNICFLLQPRFPDQYFAFQEQGTLEWELLDIDFPFNQLNPRIRELAVQLVWEEATPVRPALICDSCEAERYRRPHRRNRSRAL